MIISSTADERTLRYVAMRWRKKALEFEPDPGIYVGDKAEYERYLAGAVEIEKRATHERNATWTS